MFECRRHILLGVNNGNNTLKSMRKEAFLAYLKPYFNIRSKGLRKTTKTSGRIAGIQGYISNQDLSQRKQKN
jgi:hypothetical protein